MGGGELDPDETVTSRGSRYSLPREQGELVIRRVKRHRGVRRLLVVRQPYVFLAFRGERYARSRLVVSVNDPHVTAGSTLTLFPLLVLRDVEPLLQGGGVYSVRVHGVLRHAGEQDESVILFHALHLDGLPVVGCQVIYRVRVGLGGEVVLGTDVLPPLRHHSGRLGVIAPVTTATIRLGGNYADVVIEVQRVSRLSRFTFYLLGA